MARRKKSSSTGVLGLVVLVLIGISVKYWSITVPILGLCFLIALIFPKNRHTSGKRSKTTAGEKAFRLEVVGESNYQNALENICNGKSEEGADEVVPAQLIPEDTNPYDKNAVRVEIKGSIVGYLSRPDAVAYRSLCAAKTSECNARIRGGWVRGGGDCGDFGVRLDFELY